MVATTNHLANTTCRHLGVLLSQKPDTDPAALFADQTESYRARLELAKDADELTAAEQAARTRTLQLMQQWGKLLQPR